MTYTVLARKYRPQTFADLSGQEHVTRTLGNAIASGRVAHAFLFTGVRGVGKTTTARILAKALNCSTGPTSAPCGVCDACREITVGTDLDVLEIDGASNNSVEDVRRLQETIPFRPARDRFKIVIVDEVHMLSVGAFNAFLKTLEEPPPHVKFIFATTESHKVPITIRSRCQRYDFRLIPQAVVAERVRHILAAESIQADDAAVAIVAREAAGSMRDALTLLDQVVAFSGTTLVGDEVARVLGIADREILHTTASGILDGDGALLLRQVDALAQRGLDLLHFTKALVEFLRDLVVLRVSGADTELVAMVEEERRRALDLAKRVEPLEIQRAFHASSMLVEDVARSPLPRMTLEMGLVRMAVRPALRPVGELVARLEAFESQVGRGPAGRGGQAPQGRASGRESSSRPQRAGAAPGDDVEPDPAPSASSFGASFGSSPGSVASPSFGSSPGTVAAPTFAAPASRSFASPGGASTSSPGTVAAPGPSAGPRAMSAASPATLGAPRAVGRVQPDARVVSSVGTIAAPRAFEDEPSFDAPPDGFDGPPPFDDDSFPEGPPPDFVDDDGYVGVVALDEVPRDAPRPKPAAQRPPLRAVERPSEPPRDAERSSPARPSSPPARPASPSRGSAPPTARPGGKPVAPPPVTHTLSPDALVTWEALVGVLAETKPALGALFKHAVPRRVEAGAIVISFPPSSFFGKQAESGDARAALEQVAVRRFGSAPTIEVTYSSEPGSTLAHIEEERAYARLEATRKKALFHPIVQEALRVFETTHEVAEVVVEADEGR